MSSSAPAAPEPPVVPAAAPPQAPASLSERRALGVFCLLALLLVARVVLPLGIGLLLGTLTAFTLQPFYVSLCRRFRRPMLAALACTVLVALTAGATLAGLGYMLVHRGIGISRSLADSLQPGGSLRALSKRGTILLNTLHIPPDTFVDQLRDAASDLTKSLGGIAAAVAGVTAHGLLVLFFLLLTTFYMLRRWGVLTRRLALLLPISPKHTTSLMDELRRVGRSVLLGTILTGLAQGALAGVGFAITRVPQPLFFGALTAVASLVPAVGTLLVWVPAGVYLILTGHGVMGTIELIYGLVVVVGVSDYVIRPALVGGGGEEPALLTFIALFGGVEAFGLIGLVLGPVIMSLSIAVLRIYEQEKIADRALPTGPTVTVSDAPPGTSVLTTVVPTPPR